MSALEAATMRRAGELSKQLEKAPPPEQDEHGRFTVLPGRGKNGKAATLRRIGELAKQLEKAPGLGGHNRDALPSSGKSQTKAATLRRIGQLSKQLEKAERARTDLHPERGKQTKAATLRRAGQLSKQLEKAPGTRTDVEPLPSPGKKLKAATLRRIGQLSKQLEKAPTRISTRCAMGIFPRLGRYPKPPPCAALASCRSSWRRRHLTGVMALVFPRLGRPKPPPCAALASCRSSSRRRKRTADGFGFPHRGRQKPPPCARRGSVRRGGRHERVGRNHRPRPRGQARRRVDRVQS